MNKYLFILLFSFTYIGYTQQNTFNGNPDTSFENARQLAFNKQRKQAQDTLKLILTKYPDYHDIRSFLASTYSWDGNYKRARKEFNYILQKDTDRLDTWEAAIKNELYDDKPFEALELTKKSLKHFPDHPDLLYLKASAEEKLNNPETAIDTIDYLLSKHPEDEKAQNYKNDLINKLSYNSIGFRATVEIYSEVFDPMQYYLVQYGRQTKYGSLNAKLNFSRRFAENGAQFELDLYPKITKGLYAYANFGYSNSFLYPEIRYGAELYKSLPKSFEASLGFRALQYSETTTILTGSIGWYTGNSYWSLRSYITPDDAGSSISGTLNYRKYRKDANNYFSIDAGMGFSPEIYRFAFGGNENTIINLKSQKLNLGYFFTSKNDKNLWGIRSGVVHQESSFNPGSYFWIFDIGLSWDIKFR